MGSLTALAAANPIGTAALAVFAVYLGIKYVPGMVADAKAKNASIATSLGATGTSVASDLSGLAVVKAFQKLDDGAKRAINGNAVTIQGLYTFPNVAQQAVVSAALQTLAANYAVPPVAVDAPFPPPVATVVKVS